MILLRGLSQFVELATSPEKGRYAKAKHDIMPGNGTGEVQIQRYWYKCKDRYMTRLSRI